MHDTLCTQVHMWRALDPRRPRPPGLLLQSSWTQRNSPHAFMIFDSVPTKPSQVLPVAGFKPSCRKNPRRWHAELDPCFWAWPKLWAATMLPPCIRSNVNRQASTSNRHLKATDEGVTVAARIVHVWPTNEGFSPPALVKND